MLRKFVCAAVLCAFGLGVAFADEFNALITKVEGSKVTFKKVKGFGKNRELGEEETISAAKDVKVVTAKFSKGDDGKFKIEAGDALKGGLKNKRFKDIDEKGVFARIVTGADNKKITEVRVFPKFGKKKKDNQ